MRNRGVEALLSLTPVQTRSVTWTSTVTYARNRSAVLDLANGVSRILLQGGLFGEMNLYAQRGQPYGAIWGYDFKRDAERRLLVGWSCLCGL